MKKKMPQSNEKIHIFQLIKHETTKKLVRSGEKTTIHSKLRKTSWQFIEAILALVFLAGLFPVAFYLLGTDYTFFNYWFLTSTLAALAVYPLALKLCRRCSELAFVLSLPLGLSLISLSVWLLAYLRLAKFSNLTIYVVTAIWAIISYSIPSNFKSVVATFIHKRNFASLFMTFASFGYLLLLMSFVRALLPAARGLEKFMDFGFMMSLWRSDYLPAQDMWLAGDTINYYYYGQFAYTTLAKAAQISPRFSYNLSLASSFAYMFTTSFGIAYYLLKKLVKRLKIKTVIKTLLAWLAGISTAIFSCFAGNSHDFFISPIALAKNLLIKLSPYLRPLGDFNSYYFPDATRYIGYNPSTADKTIHEFPYYSFLVGDLHAHLANTVFVLLFIFILILMLDSQKFASADRLVRLKKDFTLVEARANHVFSESSGAYPSSRSKILTSFLFSRLTSPYFYLPIFLLAIFMMGNFWDFPIYFVVLAFFILYSTKRHIGARGQFASFPLGVIQLVAIFLPFLLLKDPLLQLLAYLAAVVFSIFLYTLKPSLWTSVGLHLTMSFAFAQSIAYPFNSYFSPMAKEIKLVSYHTPLYQLLVLYGPQLIIALFFSLSIFFLAILRKKYFKAQNPFIVETSKTEVAQGGNTTETKVSTHDKKRLSTPQRALLPESYKKSMDKKHSKLKKQKTSFTQRSFIRRINKYHMAILLIFICAFGLILSPEFIYVRDIYENGYARANTMFKFTYQACLLLNLVLPTATIALACEFIYQRSLNHYKKKHSWSESSQPDSYDKTLGMVLASPVQSDSKSTTTIHHSSNLRHLHSWPLLICAVLSCFLWLAPLTYPLAATKGWIPALKLENYQGLDSWKWMTSQESDNVSDVFANKLLQDEYVAIKWLNANIVGQPTILEAAGESYTDKNVISAYTGLPTVIGWQTHEWLWRTTETETEAYTNIVLPRQSDVKAIYECSDPKQLRSLLDLYDIKLIVIGKLERSTYPLLNEALLNSVGRQIFQNGDLQIIAYEAAKAEDFDIN